MRRLSLLFLGLLPIAVACSSADVTPGNSSADGGESADGAHRGHARSDVDEVAPVGVFPSGMRFGICAHDGVGHLKATLRLGRGHECDPTPVFDPPRNSGKGPDGIRYRGGIEFRNGLGDARVSGPP